MPGSWNEDGTVWTSEPVLVIIRRAKSGPKTKDKARKERLEQMQDFLFGESWWLRIPPENDK